MEQYFLSPPAQIEDPLRNTSRDRGALGGLSSGNAILSGRPFCLKSDLNEYVRFLRPGKYLLYVSTRRVIRGVPDISNYGSQMKQLARLTLVSNLLSLTLLPAPAAWQAAQLARITAALDSPDTPPQARGLAERELRFLDTYGAGVAMAQRLGSRTTSSFQL